MRKEDESKDMEKLLKMYKTYLKSEEEQKQSAHKNNNEAKNVPKLNANDRKRWKNMRQNYDGDKSESIWNPYFYGTESQINFLAPDLPDLSNNDVNNHLRARNSYNEFNDSINQFYLQKGHTNQISGCMNLLKRSFDQVTSEMEGPDIIGNKGQSKRLNLSNTISQKTSLVDKAYASQLLTNQNIANEKAKLENLVEKKLKSEINLVAMSEDSPYQDAIVNSTKLRNITNSNNIEKKDTGRSFENGSCFDSISQMEQSPMPKNKLFESPIKNNTEKVFPKNDNTLAIAEEYIEEDPRKCDSVWNHEESINDNLANHLLSSKTKSKQDSYQ